MTDFGVNDDVFHESNLVNREYLNLSNIHFERANRSLLLSADGKLTEVAEKEGTKAVNIEAEPEKVFEILYNRSKRADTKEEASEIVNALEDLAMSAIQDRHTSAVEMAINTAENMSRSFCQKWKGENPGYDSRHPIRVVAESVGKIGYEAVLAGMDEIGDRCVATLCSMGFHHYDNNIHIDVWIFASIQEIANALIKKKQGSGCIDQVIMEAKVAADLNKMSLAHWLICTFDDFARSAESCKDLDAARTLAIGIEILAETFVDEPTSFYTLSNLQQATAVLERFSKDDSFGSYRGFFGERGWAGERSISEILKKARRQIVAAGEKAFTPTSGDWPTPYKR